MGYSIRTVLSPNPLPGTCCLTYSPVVPSASVRPPNLMLALPGYPFVSSRQSPELTSTLYSDPARWESLTPLAHLFTDVQETCCPSNRPHPGMERPRKTSSSIAVFPYLSPRKRWSQTRLLLLRSLTWVVSELPSLPGRLHKPEEVSPFALSLAPAGIHSLCDASERIPAVL